METVIQELEIYLNSRSEHMVLKVMYVHVDTEEEWEDSV